VAEGGTGSAPRRMYSEIAPKGVANPTRRRRDRVLFVLRSADGGVTATELVENLRRNRMADYNYGLACKDLRALENLHLARSSGHPKQWEAIEVREVGSGHDEQTDLAQSNAWREAWVCPTCPNITDALGAKATCAGSVFAGTEHEPTPMRRVVVVPESRLREAEAEKESAIRVDERERTVAAVVEFLVGLPTTASSDAFTEAANRVVERFGSSGCDRSGG
jgi:hypothetical protein